MCYENMFMSCAWPLACVFAGCTRRNWTVLCRKPWVPSCGADKLWTTPVLRWSLPNVLCYTDLTLPCQVLHTFFSRDSCFGVLIFCITALVLLHLSACGIASEYVSGGERGCVVLPGLRNGFLAKSEHLCFLNEQSFWSGKVKPGVVASLTPFQSKMVKN